MLARAEFERRMIVIMIMIMGTENGYNNNRLS